MHLTAGKISGHVATYVVTLPLLIGVCETCMVCVCRSKKPPYSHKGQDCAKWNNNRLEAREEGWGRLGLTVKGGGFGAKG